MSRPWTQDDDAILRGMFPDTLDRKIAIVLGRTRSAIKNRAVTLGLRKSDEYMATRPGCFKPGQTSWNAGISFNPGGRSIQTRFKPGQTPRNTLPIGSERISKDGLLERKVSETGRRWRTVHSLIWEQHNGPVPRGHIVVFRDGDKRNFDPGNLELISRSENMQRNSRHNLPPEISNAYQLIGALNRQINKREKGVAA